MENIAVFYGGKSVEHEVSIITAIQIMQNIDENKFKIHPVYIDKSGKWWTLKEFLDKTKYINIQKAKKNRVKANFGEPYIIIDGIINKKIKIDVALICCHGTNGEDGVLQGVFESLNIPYSGCAVLSSSVCMNKIYMKELFEHYKMPIVEYLTFKRDDNIDFEKIEKEIKYPMFVKPANLGSSVGINKCEDLQELKTALEVAFSFDEFVIIERGVENLKEINVSVQRINNKIETSELEHPISWTKFLSFEEKYVSKHKSDKKREIGIRLPQKLEEQIDTLAKQAYIKFNLSGVIRIDFLYDLKAKNLYINEINTIPGSLAFYLWKGKGISLREHITLQIVQAKNKWQIKDKNITDYTNTLLK